MGSCTSTVMKHVYQARLTSMSTKHGESMSCRFGGGVPCKQYKLIHKDGLRISQYIARTLDGAAMHSHMRKDNYFYFNCCTGRFARESCPSYLKQDSFDQLKGGDIDKLEIMNGVFMQALMSRKYTKVTHADMSLHEQSIAYCALLASPPPCYHEQCLPQ